MTGTSTSTTVGEARWWLGGLAVIKATAESTGGQLAIIEVTEPAGTEAPLHVHHNEDEGFLVLEGSVTIYVGDETVDARAGTSRGDRETSRIATRSAPTAAGCCSSAPLEGSRSS